MDRVSSEAPRSGEYPVPLDLPLDRGVGRQVTALIRAALHEVGVTLKPQVSRCTFTTPLSRRGDVLRAQALAFMSLRVPFEMVDEITYIERLVAAHPDPRPVCLLRKAEWWADREAVSA